MNGIKNGMVMQRNGDNVCEIWLQSEVGVVAASYHGQKAGTVTVTQCEDKRYLLSGIPVGGPYQVEINQETFSDIYVGDVWILAGQSNMEGVGWLSEEDLAYEGDPEVRALYMEDEWRPAKHPLHTMWTAVDKVHTEVLGCNAPGAPFRGVGPGLRFADKMKEFTHVPQGLICCAHGGTTMAQWSPEIKSEGPDKSLYAAMLRRFHANGAHVRGMFWYQGCSEALCATNDSFIQNMQKFVSEVRKDFKEQIPVVQVQIATVFSISEDQVHVRWNDIREKQRKLPQIIDRLYTVSTMDKSMDDMIHLSNQSQQKLGEDAAESMYHLVYGEDSNSCLPPPAYTGHKVYTDPVSGAAIVEVEYTNLKGSLTSSGRPYGFELTRATDHITDNLIHDIKLDGNKVILRITYPVEQLGKEQYLFYGFGLNPYCNITDEKGRPIPGMGPISVHL